MSAPPFNHEPRPHDAGASWPKSSFDVFLRLSGGALVLAVAMAGVIMIVKASDMYTSLKLNEAVNAPRPVAP